MENILIVGYGNPLRRDDGVGWRAADILDSHTPALPADIRRMHQLTPELSFSVAAADLVIFMDAAHHESGGSVTTSVVRPSPSSAWTHVLKPDHLFALVMKAYGRVPNGVLITGGVKDFGLGECLTPQGEQVAQLVAEQARAFVAEHVRRTQIKETSQHHI
jgi:hydrogenase maturation protease